MEELNPRLQGLVQRRLEESVGEWKIIEELMRQAGIDRTQAEHYIHRVGPPVYTRMAGRYQHHVVIGSLLLLAAAGILVATFMGGKVIVFAIGAATAGAADFSYGYFGRRRCLGALARIPVAERSGG